MWKKQENKPAFDLVFIDPPFQLACQWGALELLTPELLAPRALVYLEAPKEQPKPSVWPESCDIVREKSVGDVSIFLVERL